MKTVLLLFALLLCRGSQAQFKDFFDDHELAADPPWTGMDSAWQVYKGQLQSKSTKPNSFFYLSTYSSIATAAEWEFWVALDFNPSSQNYVDVYLTSDSSNLLASNNNGYFVRIGGPQDEVSLYRKSANAAGVKLIDGTDGITNRSRNILKIKATRDDLLEWRLYLDQTGTGNNYLLEGKTTDTTFTTSAYFGILVRQSGSSFFQKHFFDDIVVREYVPDLTPPRVDTLIAVNAQQLDVRFSEPIDPLTAEQTMNYLADNGLGNPASILQDPATRQLIHLYFRTPFNNSTVYTLLVKGIKDITGNELQPTVRSFFYYTPQPYDVIIQELFADPDPSVGLPADEFVEIMNKSRFPLNLEGWKLGNNNTMAALPAFILAPDSLLILCSLAASARYTPYGKTLGLNGFPSLNNEGDLLILKSRENKTIHAVAYNNSWYRNEVKKEGGWSLEMIDTRYPCGGSSNWKASENEKGGTPGRPNAVAAKQPDSSPPDLLRAAYIDSVTIELLFNKTLDSTHAVLVSHYQVDPGMGLPLMAIAPGPLFQTVQLKLSQPMQKNKIYYITVKDMTDCSGNAIGLKNTARVGIPLPLDSGNLVINEILFNPFPGGKDFVEIYNRTEKILDMKELLIANRSNDGNLASIAPVANDNFLIFPKDYLVFTESTEIIKQQYLCKNPDQLIPVKSLPSYPDDKGAVVLLNRQGKTIDEFDYDARLHFRLITDPQGVSLERLDPETPAQTASNWHSAAATVGFATPTYENSQSLKSDSLPDEFSVQPAVFFPDNDGWEDIAIIQYSFPEPGWVANITIFDSEGRPVRYLSRNTLLSNKGKFIWDGLNELHAPLRMGVYIVYGEVFNLQGKIKRFKKTIVLAKRLH